MRRQSLGIDGREVDDQTDHGLTGKVAAADAEPSDLDQAGKFRHRPDPQLSGYCVEMDTVIADQNGGGKLSCAPGENQVERQP